MLATNKDKKDMLAMHATTVFAERPLRRLSVAEQARPICSVLRSLTRLYLTICICIVCEQTEPTCSASLQAKNLSVCVYVCLSVCHHFDISNIDPLYIFRITSGPTYCILSASGG